MAKRVKLSMGCGYAVFFILLLGGLGLLVVGLNHYEEAGGIWAKEAVIPALFGATLLAGSLGYLKLARRLVREGAEETARQAQFPGQPWKWKKAWLGPAIASDNQGGAAAMWFFALFWNAISTPVAWAIFTGKINDKAAYIALIFPVVGVGLVAAAVYQTVRARKYGRARFVPSSLPGVIGGYLGGVIEVPARVVPEGQAQLTLRCVRRETRGSGKNRSTTDRVLWEREEAIAAEKWVTGPGGTRIPVLFYIPPGNFATDDSDSDNEIVWRLTAGAATPGVDFSTRFVVPVFPTGETAAPPDPGSPLLEEYSPQVLDTAALQACGVRREGDTFHFSASHLPGMRLTTAALQLGLLALLIWYWGRDVHGVVWGITLFFGLIVSLFTANVWFAHFELRVEAGDVVVTKPRPWGTKVTRVPRAEVEAIKPERAMASGESQYYSLSLAGAPGADLGAAAAAGEPFALRKLRFQLEQLKKQGNLTPDREKQLAEEIEAQRRATPKFLVPFARHIPGQTRAEAIGAMVLAAIKGK
ncbi:hypothetical protein Verru16b_01791 [Lacunisphaera limnophila]|uniref:DUF3592 domain-containing protein n=1 Tax=Lacunisphaera limnophila TaxID=1838286 RepID=A0A1D8AUZ6_9BACT|nr:hypothetical protein [Lacunisphaera limnophila]AOS44724.1 hypothetical protein Verru16b_01791 [Lacunisphaera limnophila]